MAVPGTGVGSIMALHPSRAVLHAADLGDAARPLSRALFLDLLERGTPSPARVHRTVAGAEDDDLDGFVANGQSGGDSPRLTFTTSSSAPGRW